MNKTSKTVLIFAAAATLLTACNSKETDNSQKAEGSQPPAQTEAVSENHKPVQESASQDEWSSLPEYDTIMQKIDKKDYTFKTVTDNEGKRILLLTDQKGKEKYKSIFVKETDRLKIIHLEGEGQIFNDILKSE